MTREEKIDKLALAISKHPWYENEPMENCRKMAEYQISQIENKQEQREITSQSYMRSKKQLNKRINDWFF